MGEITLVLIKLFIFLKLAKTVGGKIKFDTESNSNLHEGVVEAAPLAVGRLRGHGVGPLDGERVDGARDEHEGGQADVEPVHPCALSERRRLMKRTPSVTRVSRLPSGRAIAFVQR